MPRIPLLNGAAFDSDRKIIITFLGVGFVGSIITTIGTLGAGHVHTSVHALFILLVAFGMVVTLIAALVLAIAGVGAVQARLAERRMQRSLARARRSSAVEAAGRPR